MQDRESVALDEQLSVGHSHAYLGCSALYPRQHLLRTGFWGLIPGFGMPDVNSGIIDDLGMPDNQIDTSGMPDPWVWHARSMDLACQIHGSGMNLACNVMNPA